MPPGYSAIKVQGERAYDLAREGETVTLEPRTVVVHRPGLSGSPTPDHAEFEIRVRQRHLRAGLGARPCPRRWARWAMCRPLRRLAVGRFSAADAIPLEMLKGFMHSPAAFEHLRPISTALDGIPALAVTGPDAVRLRSGNPILMRANLFARHHGRSRRRRRSSGAHGLSLNSGRRAGCARRIGRKGSYGRFVYSTLELDDRMSITAERKNRL